MQSKPNQGEYVAGVFANLKKAFAIVYNKILLEKL